MNWLLGRWLTPENRQTCVWDCRTQRGNADIQYVTEGEIPGVTLHSKFAASSSNTMQSEVHCIKCLIYAVYHGDLHYIQHVRFIQIFLFSKLWYVALILPIIDEAARISLVQYHGTFWTVQYSTLPSPFSRQHSHSRLVRSMGVFLHYRQLIRYVPDPYPFLLP